MLRTKRVSNDTQRFATKMALESRRVGRTQPTPPPFKPCLQHICCIHYLKHWPLPKVLKVFSVVLALCAHIVTIDEPR